MKEEENEERKGRWERLFRFRITNKRKNCEEKKRRTQETLEM